VAKNFQTIMASAKIQKNTDKKVLGTPVEAVVYSQNGKKSGTIELPANIFGLSWNADLVHQVITSMMTNARSPIAHTKDRGEVSGGGKKPWRQKGTGKARHGSRRSPIWVGGGVTGGPSKDKNFDRKVNKKMKAKALFTILSRKLKDGHVLFVDQFTMSTPKTKDALTTLASLAKISGFEKLVTKKKNAAHITIDGKNKGIELSFRNIGSVTVDELRNLNPIDLMSSTYLVVTNPAEAIQVLQSKSLVK
jgi:large subunit ribosomal protein L4